MTWWHVCLGPLPEHPFGVSFVWWSDTNSRGAHKKQALPAVFAALLFIFIIQHVRILKWLEINFFCSKPELLKSSISKKILET